MLAKRFRIPVAGLLILLLASWDSPSLCWATGSDEVRFTQQIRPILSENCFQCHGPNEADREADLRLDTREGAFAKLDDLQIVVPGKPEASELYRRITAADEDERMPPADSEKKLTAAEISLLKRWIEQGAPWQDQWSFVAPVRPPLPEVKNAEWVRTPIDRFVLARLETEGLSPSAEADRRTLIRRVTFDLTGLPPTLKDVQAFLADTSPDAYEKVVDRLLTSPRYGEQMARFWLDAARYGDTHGLHLDNYREMWPYRDWVIHAFNANMPYDEFTIEQLAGDLLPNATLEQQVASGFNRCHVTTNEGGSIAEEVYVRNVVDRVSTTGTVFLGLTLGCAVCHDHKFDPITQQEFYQLFAFFNNLDGQAMDGNVKDPAPTVRVPTPEQKAAIDAIRSQIAKVNAQRDDRLQAAEAGLAGWIDQRVQQAEAGPTKADDEVADGLVVHCDLDETAGTQVANAAAPGKPGQVIGTPHWIEGQTGGGIQVTAKDYVSLGNICRFEEDNGFSYGAWVRTAGKANGAVIAKIDTKKRFKGYDLFLEGRRVGADISARLPGYAIKITTKNEVLQGDQWHHVFLTYDGSKLASGVVLYVDGKPQPVDINSDSLKDEDGITSDQPLLLGRRDVGSVLDGVGIDEVRLYDRQLSDVEVQTVYLGAQLAPIFASPRKKWTDPQRQLLRQFYVIRNDPTYNKLSAQLAQLEKQLHGQQAKVATTLVFRERKQPRDAFKLIRGQYDHRGEKVERRTPVSLPPMAKEMPRDRLGLAEWLVSAKHPLTSRVEVNRLWQQVFGIGLVETAGDFGSQGSPPSHPKLLDWLAVEFRESDWDIKRLMKLLVMSAAYRQSSQVTPELAARDPHNRLLARGPRFRLDAEMLRDQALAVSGLLVEHVGGPSVKPPQPVGLWKAVGYSGSNTVQFKKDTGPDKVYRRSLYTFWKRTSPPPEMSTFDAPSRESCVVRRERTDTPLQALLLMNDPQYVEAARHLAERILKQTAGQPGARARWAFEKVTLRSPSESELDELITAAHDFHSAYAANPNAAAKLIAIGETPPDASLDPVELATWTMMANLLLNLDEVVTKE